MNDFIQAVFNPNIPFLRNALIIGILSSIPFGVIGTFVVIRKISYIAGAISHSVLAGIGFSLYAKEVLNWVWITPMVGAFFAALLSAVIIGSVKSYSKEREDTIIGAIWAIGMAVGLIFISKTPGYTDPMSYLFGNILLVSNNDVILVLILDLIIIVVSFLFFNKLQASSFDDEYTAIRGESPNLYYFMILVLTAITVVLMTTVVGIVMVIALLTIPAAIGGLIHKRLAPIIFTTIVLTIIFSVTGIAISYNSDSPTGPVIIVLAGAVYLLLMAFKLVILKLSKKKQAASHNNHSSN